MNDLNAPAAQKTGLSDFAERDRALWDRVATDYCRKDLRRSSRVARRLRTRQTIAALPLGLAEGLPRVLEIGCGAGFGAEYLQGMYSDYCGVDYSSGLIDLAREQHPGPTTQFVASDINTFEPGRAFDVVFAIGVLHHLDDIPGALRKVLGMLRPGGWFVANEPSPGNPLVSLARRVRKRVDANYSDEQRELSGPELRSVVEHAGFTDVSLKAQGIFSTPFAEVVLNPQLLSAPLAGLAGLACAADRALEATVGGLLKGLSWNLIVAGRRPLEA